MKLNTFTLGVSVILFGVAALCTSCQTKKTSDTGGNKELPVKKDTIIDGFAFVKVGAGPFLLGRSCEKKELPYTYYMMKYEVTNAQYLRYLEGQLEAKKIFVRNGKVYKAIHGMPDLPDSTYYLKILNRAISFDGQSFHLDSFFANHPVISVNWIGATDFCLEHGFKLPNRDEWEKAARGMNAFDFPWGNEIDSTYANYWNSGDPYEPGTTPVGFYNGKKYGNFQTHDGASAYGCYDMAGNAWEYLEGYMRCRDLGGAGGGFNYHTPAFLTVYNCNTFGLPEPTNIDRCDTADGFRAVFKYE